jgi:hypothetical protein
VTIPKKHHYLPQFYLEGFKITPQPSKIPHIWMIQKTSQPVPVRPSIVDTACEVGYHDDDADPDNKDRCSIERVFSTMEGAHASTIRDVISNKKISAEHRESLALFVSIMRCRVPSFKRCIERYLQASVSSTTRLELRSGRAPTPPPQVADLIARTRDDIFDVTISNWMLSFQMINAGMRSHYPVILEKMCFSLVEAEEKTDYITCDSPVALYVPDCEKRGPYGVGLADKEIEVSIPLSARFLLLISWQTMPEYQVADSERVEEFNRRAIVTADRFIYASKVTDGLVRDMSSLHKSFSGFDMQVLDYGRGFAHIARFLPVSDLDTKPPLKDNA